MLQSVGHERQPKCSDEIGDVGMWMPTKMSQEQCLQRRGYPFYWNLL